VTDQIAPPPARELTDEEAKERAEECYKLDQRIKDAFRAGREALWDAAAALREFDEKSGWTALGYETLGDWLADPEVGMTRRTYQRLIITHRELTRRNVPKELMAKLDVSKVDIVLPSIKAGTVKLSKALDDAQAMGARDLRETYYKRPDPAQKDDEEDEPANVGTQPGEDEYPAPANDGNDTPQWAGDGDDEEPAHNESPAPSGQVQDGAVADTEPPPGKAFTTSSPEVVVDAEVVDVDDDELGALVTELRAEGEKTANWRHVRELLKAAADMIEKLRG
jgi:hypothetical protein